MTIAAFKSLAIALLMFAVSRVVAVEPQKHLVTIDDLRGWKYLAQIQLSPNGKLLAYSFNEKLPEIWLVATELGSVPRKIAQGTFPIWSPDGKQLAFYSRASGTFQLWVFKTESGGLQQVTQLTGGIQPDPQTAASWGYDPLRYAWSPDSTRLVFPSQVAVHTAQGLAHSNGIPRGKVNDEGPLILTAQTPPDWTLAGLFRVEGFGELRGTDGKGKSLVDAAPLPVMADHLFVIDIRNKKLAQLTKDNEGYFAPGWSPDGAKILCVSPEGRPLSRGSYSTNLYVVDVHTGQKAALTSDSDFKSIPSWSPDGQSIAFFGSSPENIGKRFLYVMKSGRGVPFNVTSKLDRSIHYYCWSGDGKTLVANYQDGTDMPLARLSISTGDFEVISGRESALRLYLTVSRSGAVAWTQSDPSGPEFIRLLPTGERTSHILVDTNPEIRKWELGVQEVVRWRNGRAEDMEGVLIKPVNYQEGRQYPIIVDAYPQMMNDFKGDPMLPGQAWASRGYMVFYPNAGGPHVWDDSWKSIDNTAARGPKGVDIAVDGVVSGVDELIRRGFVDPNRMCLYGFSNGGGIVNQVVTKSDRFKCAVSVAAALSADWSLPFFLGTHAKNISDIAGVTPWDNPKAYIELSAVYRLPQVKTPMLLADGDNDGFFLLGSIEMYNGLRYLGKEVTFLRYPNQGHGFEGAAMKDFWERENAFFDRYLKPETPQQSLSTPPTTVPLLSVSKR